MSAFVGMEDTILYAACFDANTGLFETILGAEDAVISDELNHASIIDGVRLCKASRYRYKNNDMADLEGNLKAARAAGARRILITTDGVFSMDGTVAQLDAICDLADQYGAMVHHDDCHATGFMGVTGRGVHEHCGVMSRVDIITGTFGKALGGGSGGFTAGRQEIIDILRQRSRPYLFSNTLAPAICAASLKVLDMLEGSTALRDTLHSNTQYFREQMQAHGFAVPAGDHPIVPVMLGDAVVAQRMSERLLELGIYAVGFFYPVVPKGKGPYSRTDISRAHQRRFRQSGCGLQSGATGDRRVVRREDGEQVLRRDAQRLSLIAFGTGHWLWRDGVSSAASSLVGIPCNVTRVDGLAGNA